MDKEEYMEVTIGGETFKVVKLHTFAAPNREVRALEAKYEGLYKDLVQGLSEANVRVAALEAKLAAAQKEGAAVAGWLMTQLEALEKKALKPVDIEW